MKEKRCTLDKKHFEQLGLNINAKALLIPNSFKDEHINLIKSTKTGLFKNCKKLESIILPNTLININAETFKNCISLKNVYIPQNVEKIGASAFCDCINLEKINIPQNVIVIGANAFRNCIKLKRLSFSSFL